MQVGWTAYIAVLALYNSDADTMRSTEKRPNDG